MTFVRPPSFNRDAVPPLQESGHVPQRPPSAAAWWLVALVSLFWFCVSGISACLITRLLSS